MELFKYLLIISVTLTTLCAQGSIQSAYYNSHINNIGTISAPKNYEKDYVSNKNNNFTLSATQNSSTISLQRNQNQDNSLSDGNVPFLKALKNTIKYIQDETYLENNIELALRLLLFQIQPNAP